MRLARGSSPHTRGALRIGATCPISLRIIPAYAGSTTCRKRPISSKADHPRIRGEHARPRSLRRRRLGSSPHTRGAPSNGRISSKSTRIIPAYAGSTDPNRSFGEKMADHPRIRGEHGPILSHASSAAGSSPHTRGARQAGPEHRVRERIIPAYAGSTPGVTEAVLDETDHPRIRGEHPRAPVTIVHGAGSSPHTRGARHSSILRRALMTDHPRIRGEHEMRRVVIGAPEGSSPHTRGARPLRGRAPLRRRIIPAYAGSTPLTDLKSVGGGDHPRIRGEHADAHAHTPSRPGSSPHTRGAPKRAFKNARIVGIIPAYAGSTTKPIRIPDTGHGIIPAYAGSTYAAHKVAIEAGDHPRIRGEHVPASLVSSFGNGSSPHTRGARAGVGDAGVEVRIIPAYAGSTSWRS